jgi:hypothetical protein
MEQKLRRGASDSCDLWKVVFAERMLTLRSRRSSS